jgi:hypothetical protein
MEFLRKHEAKVQIKGKDLRLVLKFGALRRMEDLLGRRGGSWDLPTDFASYGFLAAYICAAGEWAEIGMRRPTLDELDEMLTEDDFDQYFAAAWEGFGFKEAEEKLKAKQEKEAEEKRLAAAAGKLPPEAEAPDMGEATASADTPSIGPRS